MKKIIKTNSVKNVSPIILATNVLIWEVLRRNKLYRELYDSGEYDKITEYFGVGSIIKSNPSVFNYKNSFNKNTKEKKFNFYLCDLLNLPSIKNVKNNNEKPKIIYTTPDNISKSQALLYLANSLKNLNGGKQITLYSEEQFEKISKSLLKRNKFFRHQCEHSIFSIYNEFDKEEIDLFEFVNFEDLSIEEKYQTIDKEKPIYKSAENLIRRLRDNQKNGLFITSLLPCIAAKDYRSIHEYLFYSQESTNATRMFRREIKGIFDADSLLIKPVECETLSPPEFFSLFYGEQISNYLKKYLKKLQKRNDNLSGHKLKYVRNNIIRGLSRELGNNTIGNISSRDGVNIGKEKAVYSMEPFKDNEIDIYYNEDNNNCIPVCKLVVSNTALDKIESPCIVFNIISGNTYELKIINKNLNNNAP